MNDETDKKGLNPTSAYEPVEEGYDPKKERKSHIGWIIFFSVILVLMLTSEARGQWQFIVLCFVFLLISGFFVAKGIRFIVRRWREVGEMYDFIASLSPEEKAEFDKAIANGDVRIVRGDDGKIHTEALDFAKTTNERQ